MEVSSSLDASICVALSIHFTKVWRKIPLMTSSVRAWAYQASWLLYRRGENAICALLINSITIILSLCSCVPSIHFYLFVFSVLIAHPESFSAQTVPQWNSSKSMGAAAIATARRTYTLIWVALLCSLVVEVKSATKPFCPYIYD